MEEWDVIVVGAGHNGLACAAYLADPSRFFSTPRERVLAAQDAGRSGGGGRRRVLVLERGERVGGACTLKTWKVRDGDELVISPCAYLAGLLHPIVIDELALESHGFSWTAANGGFLIPHSSGDCIWLPDDDDKSVSEVARVAPGDVEGWKRLKELFDRVRDALRPADPTKDIWLGEPPTREFICRRLREAGLEGEMLLQARRLLFSWSMAELLDNFLTSEQLKFSLMGQGIIGTNASPYHPGTAYIWFHHMCGRLYGMAGQWGYVKGGMGKISDYLAEIAKEAGVVVRTSSEASRIVPGRGVILANGETLRAPVVVSNADPRTTLKLLGNYADPVWSRKVLRVPMEGCVVKVNLAMEELPKFKGFKGLNESDQHLAQVNIPLETREDWEACYEKARKGDLHDRLWCELYFQTAVDSSVQVSGHLHHVSAFVQYVPYAFAEGDWQTRKEDVKRVVLNSLARYCTNIPSAVVSVDLLGPPDIEREIGLAGGHIFQGECLPAHMWADRLSHRTGMNGIYLCGAGTHPGGSVIGCNGRNAAVCVLQDLNQAKPQKSSL